jgi:FkbM family methyltransferase
LVSPVYLGDHTVLARILGNYKIYLDSRDQGFASHLMLDGYWEIWLTIFIAQHVRAGMVVADVGANFGYYSLLLGGLVGPEGHVYAIEPNREAATKLQHSIALNGFGSRTTVINAALGATEGETYLYVPREEPKNARVVPSREEAAEAAGNAHLVPQVTLDGVVNGEHQVDFVKIDAEGAEEGIIAGMMDILVRDRPLLVVEFNAARCRDATEFLKILLSLYDNLFYINYDAIATSTTIEELTSCRIGEDWLLCLRKEAFSVPIPQG